MASHDVKLLGRETVAEGTMVFRFEKPAAFSFKPGQAVGIELLDPPAEPNSRRRTLSLVSGAFERELAVATRMRASSAFKRALQALPLGAKIRLKGPFGDMTLHADRARPAVLIAGGIGITPFMSMVRQATHDALPQQVFLIYSNRRPEDAAFLAELLALERRNKNLRLLATMTDMSKSSRAWDGERSVVDQDLVKKFAGDIAAPKYYLAGPPAMVEAITDMLRRAGVEAEAIRSEEFYGYQPSGAARAPQPA
jgi:ferredoxin-NADP reductase